jgi:hypothetical protein
MTSLPQDPERGGVPLLRLVLAVVLAILAVATIEIASLLLLAAIDGLTGARSSLLATLTLDLGSALAWLVGGALAYEVGRDRVAVGLVAVAPVLLALVLSLASLSGAHLLVRGGAAGTVAFAVALGAVAAAGGLVWERRLRRSRSVD